MTKRVVLAYSGGLDTSVAIAWLGDQGYEVVAVLVDVGQPGDLSAARERAHELGAVDAQLVDARSRFVEGFVVPAMQMNALYQGSYPLISALSRPLISQIIVKAARDANATAVAHGCTGKGNDQVRFEVSLAALAPDLDVLAPVRDWDMSRQEAIAYAAERRLPVTTAPASPYSIDENLWGRSIECGVLEDPWVAPPEDVYELTAPPDDAEGAEDVTLGFDGGLPVSVNGEVLGMPHVIEVVGKVAGAFGYGRVDMVEDRLVGIKSREIYEAPAALALVAAHQNLEALTLERAVARTKRRLEDEWATVVYEGLWFSPLREALNAFAATTQRVVTGEVRLRFTPGVCRVTGRRSPTSLYDHALATYGDGDAFDHADARGFIRLWGLPARRWATVHGTRE
jgi:argininosuccinate synthase